MATPVRVTFSVRDEKEATGRVVYYTDLDLYGGVSGDALTDLRAYFSEVAERLDVLIGGVIVDVSISIPVDLPTGIKTVADLNSDVEEKAQFSYFVPSIPATFRHEIPTFDHDIFGSAESVLYSETVDLSYYVTLLFNPTEALDWPDEYGGITEARGERCTQPPEIRKVFRKR